MVLAMLFLLILGMLLTAMLLRTRGSRKRLATVEQRLQRELALDSAFVHAFHLLKQADLPASLQALPRQPLPPGEGTLAGVPYRFRYTASATTGTIRIDVSAGDDPLLEGHAIALLVQGRSETGGVRSRWFLRYEGQDPAETAVP